MENFNQSLGLKMCNVAKFWVLQIILRVFKKVSRQKLNRDKI